MTDIERRIAALSPGQRKLLESRAQARGLALPTSLASPQRLGAETAPLSFEQEYLWFFEQLEPGTAIHNLHNTYRLPDPLDLEALRQSVDQVVERHDALRVTFEEDCDGRPIQRIAPDGQVPLSVVDLRHLESEERRVSALQRAKIASKTPFDLGCGPLIRLELQRLSDEESLLLVTMHHIIADWWSFDIFRRELAELYDAHRWNRPAALAELPIGFGDFTTWQRQWLNGKELESLLDHWKRKLDGAPPTLELPTDRPAPRVRTFGGARCAMRFPTTTAKALANLCRQEKVTLFMVLLAAMATLFQRYSGQAEVLIGSPNANRRQPGTERLLGFFMNMLVFRVDLSGDPTFRELLTRVRQMALDAYDHEALPFGKLMEGLRPERDLSRSPIFQAMLILLTDVAPAPERPFLEAVESPHNGTEEFDITFALWHGDGVLHGRCDFNTDLWDLESIERMIGHFRTLLGGITDDADRRVSELPILTPDEERQLLRGWNETATDETIDYCVHERIVAWAERTPNAVAVSQGSRVVTYRELDRRSNRLANHLRSLGIGAEDRVAICLERSIGLITAFLGVLKAGAAFVPLDPTDPSTRLTRMLADCRPAQLVSRSAIISQHGLSDRHLVLLDDHEEEIAAASAAAPPACPWPGSLAYVIYTSGSTGRPKGVMTEHRSLLNFASARVRDYRLRPEDRVLQLASTAYDAAVGDIFPCLISGGRLVLRTDGMLDSVSRFLDGCRLAGVTMLEIPTALWHEIVAQLAESELRLPRCWRVVVIAGEQVAAARLAQWHELDVAKPALFNEYGPTEAAVSVSQCHLTRAEAEDASQSRVAIGHPMANVQLYALDRSMRPVAVLLAGELYIGGPSVARGYLGCPGLTAESFVPDPFSGRPGQRLYRTGDRVRRRPGGSIEFLGRRDHQVKVSGYRIELGEIEAALIECPGVREAAVSATENGSGPRRLVAYVVREGEGPSADVLRSELKQRLADYMVPATFVMMPALPTTASGKIDRRALPEPERRRSEESTTVACRSPFEEHLLDIWSEILKLDGIGVDEGFFGLGGHSLLGMQMIARVRDAFQIDLPLRALFDNSTVSELARYIESSRSDASPVLLPPVTAVDHGGTAPVTRAQFHLWTVEQLLPGHSFYNMTRTMRLRGGLDEVCLARSLEALIDRHESLRTTFSLDGARVVQKISPRNNSPLRTVDMSRLESDRAETEARRQAGIEVRRGFDLASGPLLRVLLLRLSAEDRVLVLNVHHIVCDDWSFGVLLNDWVSLYRRLSDGGESTELDPALQFADFVHWHQNELPNELMAQQFAFWEQRLSGALPVLELLTDRPRRGQAFRVSSRTLGLGDDLTRNILALSRRENCTPFVMLLAALKALLHLSTGQEDIRVATLTENRSVSELGNVVGPLSNTLILRTKVHARQTFRELLREARETLLSSHSHQDLPFEDLATFLEQNRGLRPSHLAQVMFLKSAAGAASLKFPGIAVSEFEPQVEYPERTVNATSFELVVAIGDAEDGLEVAAMYKTALFDAATIDRLLASYRDLLGSVVTNLDVEVAALSSVDEALELREHSEGIQGDR